MQNNESVSVSWGGTGVHGLHVVLALFSLVLTQIERPVLDVLLRDTVDRLSESRVTLSHNEDTVPINHLYDRIMHRVRSVSRRERRSCSREVVLMWLVLLRCFVVDGVFSECVERVEGNGMWRCDGRCEGRTL